MMYLLDTNTCIAFLKGNLAVVEKVRTVGIENLLLCSVVKAGLWFGVRKSEREPYNSTQTSEVYAHPYLCQP
jgi:tRNA(fMet)-specific endonuclease VapC